MRPRRGSGIPASGLLPLVVVASELTPGATAGKSAGEGRGRGGRAVTQGGVGSAARLPLEL